MSKQARCRKRCAECRRWFWPRARQAKQQRVCGEPCRLARRRRQARVRRAKDPVGHREEERERKRQWRAAAKHSAGTRPGTGEAPCHAPGQASKYRQSQGEFGQIWDEVMDMSRAELERQLRRIVRQFWRKTRHGAGAGACSHAPG